MSACCIYEERAVVTYLGAEGNDTPKSLKKTTGDVGHGDHHNYGSGYGAGTDTYESFNPNCSKNTTEAGLAAITEFGAHSFGAGGACSEDHGAAIENGHEFPIKILYDSYATDRQFTLTDPRGGVLGVTWVFCASPPRVCRR